VFVKRLFHSVRRNFTKCCGDGFGLTLRQFGRRLLLPREKIAAAAALSPGAHSARTQGADTPQGFAIDPVETGFLGQPEGRARRNL
jgi:hypothetical protein